MKVSILVSLAFGIFTKVSASVTPLVNGLTNTKVCDGAALASTWIGEAKNVEIQTVLCPGPNPESYQPPSPSRDVQHVLEPQTAPENVCGAPCTTKCFTPAAGSGPNPNDCHVIADALRFDSQNLGPTFDISHLKDVILKFKSCETFFHNQAITQVSYCRTDWANLIDFIAPNCQAKQNAHGGSCVANDKAWFVQ